MLYKSLIIAFCVLFKKIHTQTLTDNGIAEEFTNKLPNCPQISKWEDLEPTLKILTDLSKDNGSPEIKTIASLSNLMKMMLAKVQMPLIEEAEKVVPINPAVLSETMSEEDLLALHEILDDIEMVLGIPTGTDKSVRQATRDEEIIVNALQNQCEIINALNAKTIAARKAANDVPPDMIPIFKPNNNGGCLERIDRVDGTKALKKNPCPCQGAKVVAANLNIPSSQSNPSQTIPAKAKSNVIPPISGNNPLLLQNKQVCVCNKQDCTNYNILPSVNSVSEARQPSLINGNALTCSNQCQLCQNKVTPKQNLLTSLNISPLTTCTCNPIKGCQCRNSIGIGNIPNAMAKSITPCQLAALAGSVGPQYTPLIGQSLVGGKPATRDQSISNQCNPTLVVKPKLTLSDVYGSLLQKMTTNVLVPYCTTKSAMCLKANS